ncbi:MAG: hypothetical protein Q3962_02790 [Corynebacterium sp.]|nr:hypothetical protein [Corynebacterium sp.]
MSRARHAAKKNKRTIRSAIVVATMTSTTVAVAPAYATTDVIVQAPICYDQNTGIYNECDLNLTKWAEWYAAPENTTFTDDSGKPAPYVPIGTTQKSPRTAANGGPPTVEDLQKAVDYLNSAQNGMIGSLLSLASSNPNLGLNAERMTNAVNWTRNVFGTSDMKRDGLLKDGLSDRTTITHESAPGVRSLQSYLDNVFVLLKRDIKTKVNELQQKIDDPDTTNKSELQNSIDTLNAVANKFDGDHLNDTTIVDELKTSLESANSAMSDGPDTSALDAAVAALKKKINDSDALTSQQKSALLKQVDKNATLSENPDEVAVNAATDAVNKYGTDTVEPLITAMGNKPTVDKGQAAYKFATDTKRTAVDTELTKWASTAETDSSAIDFSDLQSAINELDGQTNLDGVLQDLGDLDYLSDAQKGLLANAAMQNADLEALNSWAEGIKTLAANQKKLRGLRATDAVNTVKESPNYELADSNLQEAYDTAVSAAISMDTLEVGTQVSIAITNIENALNGLNGNSKLEQAKTKALSDLESLNLSEGQREVAKTKINDATSTEAVNTAYQAAESLSEARNTSVTFTDKTTAKYKFADASLKTAFDEAEGEYTRLYDDRNSTADDVNNARTSAQTADSNLNGDTVLNGVLTDLNSAKYLTSTQKGLLESGANDNADQDALNTWKSSVQTLAGTQQTLKTLVEAAPDVRETYQYKNGSTPKTEAYDSAITDGQGVLDGLNTLTLDSRVQNSITAITNARDALDGQTDLERARQSALKELETLNLTTGQKEKASTAIKAAQDTDTVTTLMTAARALSDSRTTVQNHSFTDKNANQYKFADDNLKQDFDNKSQALSTAMDADDATSANVETVYNDLVDADNALNGAKNLADVLDELSDLDYLSQTQKDALGNAAASQTDLTSLNTWATDVKTLASKQASYRALLNDAATVKTGYKYRNADKSLQTAYDQALLASVDMATLNGDPNLDTIISNIENARDALNGQTDEAVIDGLNLSTEQKNKAKSDLKATTDTAEIGTILSAARALANARTEAQKPENALVDKSTVAYRFADADLRSAFDTKATNLATVLDAETANADGVSTALQEAQTAGRALNGASVLDGILTELKGLEYLSQVQKDKLDAGAKANKTQSELNTWAQGIRDLASKQKTLRGLQADKPTVLDSAVYRNADATKQKAYTDAVDTIVSMDELSPAANLDSTIDAIKRALGALDGKSDAELAKAEIAGLNLSQAQKDKATSDIDAASDRAGINAVLGRARALSTARTQAQLPTVVFSSTDSAKYKYAEDQKKTTFTTAVDAFTTGIDAANADAERVTRLLTSAQAADNALDGQQNFNAVVEPLTKLEHLTRGQQKAVSTAAEKTKDLKELGAFAASMEKLNTQQEVLRKHLQRVDEVRKSDAYKYASEEKKQAYEEAIRAGQQYIAESYSDLDSTVLANLTSAAESITGSEDKLNGISVDYSKLQSKVDSLEAKKFTSSTQYTSAADSLKEAYQQAMAKAKEILNNKNSTQQEVNDALDALIQAYQNFAPSEAPVDELPATGSSTFQKILLVAGVSLGLVGIIIAVRNATMPPPAPVDDNGQGPANHIADGTPADAASTVTEAPTAQGTAAQDTAAEATTDTTTAPEQKPAAKSERLAATGANSSNALVAALMTIVMGLMLMLGFRRKED